MQYKEFCIIVDAPHLHHNLLTYNIRSSQVDQTTLDTKDKGKLV